MARLSFYRHLFRPLLFRMDPERAHQLALGAARLAGSVPGLPSLFRAANACRHASLRQTIAGIDFENPLGLAAGCDKNGWAPALLGSCGFGHIEIGSVSAFPSQGNALRPRLFRVVGDRAIIVCYGVPNEGAAAVAARLGRTRCPVPLGVNLVKTNDAARPSTEPEVMADYASALGRLQPHARYLTLNLSCPNSEGDRDFFDDPSRIGSLLRRLADVGPRVPVFLKLKPVGDAGFMQEVVRLADRHPFVAGFGVNLPAGKPPGLRFSSPRSQWASLPGAVAGPPVEEIINHNLRLLCEAIGPRSRFHLVAAGGVSTAEDAYRKIRLGASLVQLYTAFVYEGPGVVASILRGLVGLLQRDGYRHVSEAVGVDVHPRRMAVVAPSA